MLPMQQAPHRPPPLAALQRHSHPEQHALALPRRLRAHHTHPQPLHLLLVRLHEGVDLHVAPLCGEHAPPVPTTQLRAPGAVPEHEPRTRVGLGDFLGVARHGISVAPPEPEEPRAASAVPAGEAPPDGAHPGRPRVTEPAVVRAPPAALRRGMQLARRASLSVRLVQRVLNFLRLLRRLCLHSREVPFRRCQLLQQHLLRGPVLLQVVFLLGELLCLLLLTVGDEAVNSLDDALGPAGFGCIPDHLRQFHCRQREAAVTCWLRCRHRIMQCCPQT